MTKGTTIRRLGAAFAVLGAVAGTAGCDSLLSVDNPGAINAPTVTDSALLNAIANSTQNEFQRAFTPMAYAGAILSDEAITGHNFTQWQEFDSRVVDELNSVLPDYYNAAQRARTIGDDMDSRLRELLSNPNADIRVARTAAYSGWGHLLLGMNFCDVPLSGTTAPVPSDSVMARALVRFDQAIAVANAARAAGISQVRVDSVLHMARVGAARAALWLNQRTAAANYARLVPTAYVGLVPHSRDQNSNPFFGATTGSNPNIGVDVRFRNLNDPRIRHIASPVAGHNPASSLFLPRQSSSFTEWNPNGTLVGFTENTGVRFASGLEAQYIVAEVEGPTAANVDFINTRRAIGGQAALGYDVSATDFRDALIEQKGRDFYLSGMRLGEIRRYQRQYNLNLFPTGAHPWLGVNYSTATCYTFTLAERTGNPAF